MCRIENLSFDIEDKSGIIFLLSQSLQMGCLGYVSVASSKKLAVKYANNALKFISNQTNSKTDKGHKDTFLDLDRNDKFN